MSIIISQIKTPLGAAESEIIAKAVKIAGINPSDAVKCAVHKTSLDARKREDIHFVHSVYIDLGDAEREKKICEKNPKITYAESGKFSPVVNDKDKKGRPVIAGFGPAGMFCALALAEQGFAPVVLERGEQVEKRTAAVNSFWNGGELNENSNVQFGEGGAGTFSDGKLTTRIKDPLCGYVLERLVEFGAPKEIITKAKPHIGTDNLREIVKNIRERIIALGGEVRFGSTLTDFDYNGEKILSVQSGNSCEQVGDLVLAIGHSARDTFEMLYKKGIAMEAKPFSVGARIEHLQSAVDESLYGKYADDPLLPKGEYQLSYRDNTGRGVYTFCMCPGGVVVPAASEKGGVVTNGMSEFARDGKNANAAMVVAVTPEDFGNKPLDGVAFARTVERNAYMLTGGYKACGTTVKGFLEGKPSLASGIVPTYALGLKETEYRKLFPKFVTNMMELGLNKFKGKMRCFGDGSAILSAPETRTSSPVRITRDREELNSVSCKNLYPCGEGAGYAGGIMSAAVDGIKVALKIMSKFV